MSQISRRSRSKRSKTHRRRRGGSFATGPGSVAPGYPVIHPTQGAGPDCLAASRTGMIPSIVSGGLPGMQPGMRGGSYTVVPAPLYAAGGIAGSASATRIPCGGTLGGGSKRRRRRGGSHHVPSVIEGGKASDMAVYHAQTAGYGNRMEAVGGQVPLLLQVPYAAKSCLSGGSRRRLSRKGSKKSKKSKSHRRRQ